MQAVVFGLRRLIPLLDAGKHVGVSKLLKAGDEIVHDLLKRLELRGRPLPFFLVLLRKLGKDLLPGFGIERRT
ncbi:MAG: cell division cycle 123 family protein [Anaerolineae bacterium]|nr:cell division cycle 123 family protein [Anaerolineae bacterium]